ncbi:glycine betaine ABC transporter substrate-binding protein [Mesobaculum littorinae]|uniref:glycine betaine ABC transporter substrate-binding protein n=1 Tax=Mesobaculum littorinae TaxID=2486419 RepID=UPI0013E3ADDD|nr:glycine betaine ABC transporter substrate-binding protein [Mesobaculum littorinae]
MNPVITGAERGDYIDKAAADEYGIDTLAQLKDPGSTAPFDGEGMANMSRCNPGRGSEQIAGHQLDESGLRDTPKFFEIVKIPLAAVNAAQVKLRDGEDTEEDFVRHAADLGAENQKQWDAWIDEATAAAAE